MSVPCPACDLHRNTDNPLIALALGVSLGSGFDDMHKVTELMCSVHRAPYVIAMCKAQVMINTVDGEPNELADDLETENGGADGR